MIYPKLLLLSLLTIVPSLSSQAPMTAKELVDTILTLDNEADVHGNVVQFTHDDAHMTLIYDEYADRMRLISEITKVDDLEPDQLVDAMEANFHSTLDARYAVSDGVVWSAFLHPLSSLHEELLRDAASQVAAAKNNFGTSYSAGSWVFGGDVSMYEEEEETTEAEEGEDYSSSSSSSTDEDGMESEEDSSDDNDDEAEEEEDFFEDEEDVFEIDVEEERD